MLRKRLVWPLVVLMLLLLVGQTTPVVGAAMYTDPDGRFSFTIPDGYRPIALPASAPNTVQIGYLSPSFSGASVVITVAFALPGDAPPDATDAPIAPIPGFEPIASAAAPAMLGTHPARQWEESGPPLGGRLRLRYLVATEGTMMATVAFTAREADYAPFIQESLPFVNTFRLRNPFFTDPEGRFRFTTPMGWDVQPGAEQPIIAQVHSTTPPGDLTVSADGQPDDETLAAFVEATTASLMDTYPDAVQTGRADTMLADQPAIRITSTVTDGSTQRTIVQIIALRDDTGYVLTSTAATADQGAFGAAVDALRASWLFL